ncbi:hypothetical protein JCM14036_30390 [Desulfotomaculum defluvii]
MFRDIRHQKKYQTLMAKTKGGNSTEYSAALYLLSALDYKDVTDFVAPYEINFPALLRASRPWSTGERALVKLASVLFNYTSFKANIGDVFHSLDEENNCVALEALKIRYMR